MINTTLINELSLKIKELLDKTPTKDTQKNLNALIQGTMSKFELISREEYDTQAAVLAKTQQKLAELEEKLAQIESSLDNEDQ